MLIHPSTVWFDLLVVLGWFALVALPVLALLLGWHWVCLVRESRAQAQWDRAIQRLQGRKGGLS